MDGHLLCQNISHTTIKQLQLSVSCLSFRESAEEENPQKNNNLQCWLTVNSKRVSVNTVHVLWTVSLGAYGCIETMVCSHGDGAIAQSLQFEPSKSNSAAPLVETKSFIGYSV